MTKKQAIALLLAASRRQGGNLPSPVAGPSWMAKSNALLPEVNEGIKVWIEQDDPTRLKGIVKVMETMGQLTDKEAEYLQQTFENEGA